MDFGMLRVVPVLLRIDRRRPASWLMLVGAFASGACLAPLVRAGVVPLVAVPLVGAILAVGALGDLPLCGGVAWVSAVWAGVRAAWPAVGFGAGAAARGATAGNSWQLGVAVVIASLIGGVAAATTIRFARRRGASAADAASLALVAAGASAACGWLAGPRGSDGADLAVAGSIAIFFGAAAGIVASRCGAARAPKALRNLLTLAAMVTALGGMVAWLFLDPARAGLDLTVSLAWFVALAVPAATLGDGVSHMAGWRLLGPGRMRAALVSVAGDAAILAWPPLVSAAVMAASPERARPALVTLLALVVAAGVLLVVSWVSERLRIAPETGQAAALGIALVACMGVALAGGQPPSGNAKQPSLPALTAVFRAPPA